ncbi:MAG: hypothetical protein JJT94_08200 [Bernardetiaceae bacterium]|nr:hypothetical protein [Bernardetiaceae bacterium]
MSSCSLFLIFATFFILCACGDTQDKQNKIRFVLAERITSLDPTAQGLSHSNALIQAQIYQGLFEVGDDGLVYPAIAKSYEIFDDEELFLMRIRLREDAYFVYQEGRECLKKPIKAEDVIYSFERLIEQVPTLPAVKFFAERLERMESLNEGKILSIYLKTPYYALQNLLAAPVFAVLPAQTSQADIGKYSSGAYYIEKETTEDWILAANPFYFKKDLNYKALPYTPKIYLRTGKQDPEDRSALFFKQINDIFWANTKKEVATFIDDAQDYAEKRPFYSEDIPTAQALVLMFVNNKKHQKKILWTNYAWSRALRYSINTETLAQKTPILWQKSNEKIYNFVFPSNLEIKVNEFEYNPLRAKQLLPDTLPSNYDPLIPIMQKEYWTESIAAEWKAVGLNTETVDVEAGNRAEFLEVSLPFYEELQTWSFLDTAEYKLWHTHANLAHSHKNPTQRIFYYNKARNFISEQYNFYPLYYRSARFYIAEELQGITWRYDGIPIFERARKGSGLEEEPEVL